MLYFAPLDKKNNREHKTGNCEKRLTPHFLKLFGLQERAVTRCPVLTKHIKTNYSALQAHFVRCTRSGNSSLRCRSTILFSQEYVPEDYAESWITEMAKKEVTKVNKTLTKKGFKKNAKGTF